MIGTSRFEGNARCQVSASACGWCCVCTPRLRARTFPIAESNGVDTTLAHEFRDDHAAPRSANLKSLPRHEAMR